MVNYLAIMGGQYCQVLDNTNTHRLLCRYLILYRIPLYINREGGFRDLVFLGSIYIFLLALLFLPKCQLGRLFPGLENVHLKLIFIISALTRK